MQASMLAWVVTYWVHSTVLVLGAWLLERRWSDRPERMSAVWKTALVGGFVTATVQIGLGVAPVAGRWDLSPVLASREPGPSAGAEAVAAPAEVPVAAVASPRAGSPVVAAPSGETRPSWPPPGAEVVVARSSWPPPDAGLVVRERDEAAPVGVAAEAVLVVRERAEAAPAEVAVAREAGLASREPRVLGGVPVHAAAPVMPAERVESETGREPEVVLASASVGAVPPPASPELGASSSSSMVSAVVPWIMGVMLLGALLGLASVAVAFGALRRQLAGRRPLAEGTLPTLLAGLQRRAGIERPVRLTVAPRVQVPMAVGVLRPEIVVPIKAAEGLPPAHQESLLAHELAHVLRRDPAWRLAALLVERVFFFQPLNRLASRRVAQSAEYLCDDWAARHTRQPLALATCLTEIATWVARTGPVPATMAGPRSILGRRVQRLLQPARTSARPWWLSAALGLPLLAVVAVAPGVGAQAKGDHHRKDHERVPERVVVIDEEGRRHERQPREGGAIVVRERDGELVVQSLGEGAAAAAIAGEDDEASPRDARKAARQRERARNEARREARKELRRAFRAAKARGDAAPSRAEVEAILRRARVADGSPQPLELHVVVPGELELHGRVPVDVEALEDGIEQGALEGLRALQALEGLEGLEGFEELGPALERLERDLEGLEDVDGLEELGPALERLERDLEGLEGLEELQEALEDEGLDVVRLRRPGEADAPLHIVVSPEHARALHDAERMRHLAERDAHGAAHAQHEAIRRRAERDAARMQREELRRQLERARRAQPPRSESELPTVWMRAPEAPAAPPWGVPVPRPAPGSPVAWAHPVPPPAPGAPVASSHSAPPHPPPPAPAPRVRRLAKPVPSVAPRAPGAPVAPLPPAAPAAPVAPTAPTPSDDIGPVVRGSWPPPTTADHVAFC